MFVSLRWSERVLATVAPRQVFWACIVLTLAMFAIGVASLVRQLVSAPTPGDRRRVALRLTGSVVGLLPLALAAPVAALETSRDAFPVWVLAIVAVTLPIFPRSFAYAVAGHALQSDDMTLVVVRVV